MSKELSIEFERAVRFLVKHFSSSEKDCRKSVLFHAIRVGVYLYENGYGREIVLAGLLHDAIEWSGITQHMIKKEFGEDVLKLVLASTKDISIADKEERKQELIKPCARSGKDALIVKVADTIDSFKWYFGQKNEEQIEHCMDVANLIFELRPDNFEDKIFEELEFWQNKVEYFNAEYLDR